MWNDSITGLGRSSKSFILFKLFKEYLLSSGTREDEIIEVQSDDITNVGLRHPIGLYEYIRSKCKDGKKKLFILFP